MASILNFVYAIILFLSIFLVVMYVDAQFECQVDSDCPTDICPFSEVAKCINLICKCVAI
uniref:Late nodulin domain-containing protein n=1 Tax=Galega orientalis TaxID=47654 RepID=Q9STB7_9FABA|nr:hypothetical protein [Galega orientalis]